jgi:hypothetical protein
VEWIPCWRGECYNWHDLTHWKRTLSSVKVALQCHTCWSWGYVREHSFFFF